MPGLLPGIHRLQNCRYGEGVAGALPGAGCDSGSGGGGGAAGGWGAGGGDTAGGADGGVMEGCGAGAACAS